MLSAKLGSRPKSTELGAERDELQTELDRLPKGTKIIVLPTAIQSFAKRLKASRAKLHMALTLLEDMNELSALIR